MSEISTSRSTTEATSLKPVVVVGFVRTGAGSLARALSAATDWPIPPIPGGMRLLSALIAEAQGQFDRLDEDYRTNKEAHLIANIDIEMFKAEVRSWFETHCYDLKPEGSWIEPFIVMEEGGGLGPMMERLPELWPEARVIFVGRPGIETALSCQRGLPDLPLGRLMRLWSEVTVAGCGAVEKLGESCLFIPQPLMALRPEDAAAKVSEFLDLEDEARIALARGLCAPRASASSPGREERPLTLDVAPWPAPMREHFERVTAPAISAIQFGVPAAEGPASSRWLLPAPTEAGTGMAFHASGRLRVTLEGKEPRDARYQALDLRGFGKARISWGPVTSSASPLRAAIVVRAQLDGESKLEHRQELDLSQAGEEVVSFPAFDGLPSLQLRVVPLEEVSAPTDVEVGIRFDLA